MDQINEDVVSVLRMNKQTNKIDMDQINEDVVSVLRMNKQTNKIDIEFVKIENRFLKIVELLSNLCDNQETTLPYILSTIKANKELDQLSTHYRYCRNLAGTYQSFSACNQDMITDITKKHNEILMGYRKDPENFNLNKAISEYKGTIKSKYILWSKAYSINKTYRICSEDKSILTFSHRIDGWSNPIYHLTENFSVEIKTNFGYGKASYFFTKIRYKDIDITPFSEWIDYEFANFSEIIRYTRSHLLENDSWLNAMEFSRDASNLSVIDEVKFVETYILDECEKMVNGLEDIFNKEQFSFKNSKKNHYTVDKKGHKLIEFRGEKISGALDFISKILEFDSIIDVQSFISRIEDYLISAEKHSVKSGSTVK